MAGAALHSALEGAGFKLADSYFNVSGDRIGTAMTHHYTRTRPMGNTTVTHHIFVDEFGRHPDKPNVTYQVTHNGEQFANGRFDTLRNHRHNAPGGVKKPLEEVLAHHGRVDAYLSRQKTQPLVGVTPDALHDFNAEWPAHAVGGGLESEIRSGPHPASRLQSLNSVEGQPLDPEVYRVLTGPGNGNRFTYQGRFPDDEGTDVYQVEYPDPRSPHTFRYGFTIRHRPGETQPFSYNGMRYQAGADDDGNEDQGSFLDVTGNMDHVANFGTLPQLVRRHQDMLAALDIKPGRRMKSSVDEEFYRIMRAAKLMDQADEDLLP